MTKENLPAVKAAILEMEGLSRAEILTNLVELGLIERDHIGRRQLSRQLDALTTNGFKLAEISGRHVQTVQLQKEILRILENLQKPVTVRQIYYQCVVPGILPKSEASYRKVQYNLLAMRRSGLAPYNWVADNTRWMRKPTTYRNPVDALKSTARHYRQMVWHKLPSYVEVWCEKSALAGTIIDITSLYDVPLMITSGYSSETFAYEAVQTFLEMDEEQTKRYIVLYLGDHDPAGEHMAVNLKSKLQGFIGARSDCLFFHRLALNQDQIQRYSLPTRDTEEKQSATKQWFYNKFGNKEPSCELDALHPDILKQTIKEAIEIYLPEGYLNLVEHEERLARENLEEMLSVFAFS